MLSEVHNVASLSNLSSLNSGFKYFTFKQVSQVKGPPLLIFCGMFCAKWRSSMTMMVQRKILDIEALELTCNI